MSETLKLLIVDDEPEIRELLALMVGSFVPIEFKEAGTGQEAKQILENEKVDLVLCDFNMPQGNGKYVFEHLQKMQDPPKFVLVTSDEPHLHHEITEAQGVGYLQKPFEEQNLMNVFSSTMGILPVNQNNHDYLILSIASIMKLSPLPAEVFIKLGTDHFVKYFNAEKKITDDDKIKLLARKIKEVYLLKAGIKPFVDHLQRTAFQSLILPKDNLDHPFQIANLQNELIHLGLKGLVSNKALMEISQKSMKTVFAVVSKVSILQKLLAWINSEEVSASKIHSTVLTLFCHLIINKLTEKQSLSLSPSANLVLTYASVLHDVNLQDYFIKNEWRIIQGIKLHSSANRQDQETLGSHVEGAMDLIRGWVHCPKEVLEVVQMHHEAPTGKGFPKKLTGDQINLLSAIFIIAHEASTLVWERKNQDDFIKTMGLLSQDYKPYAHFREPLEILLQELTKEISFP